MRDPGKYTQRALLRASVGNKHESLRGQYRANQSVFLTTVLNKAFYMLMHKESDMFSYSFIKLVSRGCLEQKLTKTEGVSFVLFHAIAPVGCNAQIAAGGCVKFFR